MNREATARNPLAGNVSHTELRTAEDRRIRPRPDRTGGQASGSGKRPQLPPVLGPEQWLDDEQWLGDEHIQRDYELLTQKLQMDHPNLAAGTRFVDPLIAFQLSWGAERDALSAWQRIIYDRDH
ncbi:hypothetical protein IQ15_07446, partial [Bradyrhizobium yuanmingense]